MRCNKIITPNGPALVCGQSFTPEPCVECGNVSSALCDYPAMGGSCSAPLCKTHAFRAGPNQDYCPEHAPSIFPTPNGGRIIIGNLRRLSQDMGVRIDRGYSALANPFILKKEKDRPELVEKYRGWLWKRLQEHSGGLEDSEIQELALQSLRHDVILLCWCAPKLCHGRIVARAIIWDLKGRPALRK